MESINLGRKSGECMPVAPDNSSVHYPTLYIDDVAPVDLPDEGEMTVKYKVTSRNTSERDGKKSSSICLEIRKITDIEGEDIAGENEDQKTVDLLDKYAEEEVKKSK